MFVAKHCQFANLIAGRGLWVPYGWRCLLLSRTITSHSHALHISYVNARMLLASPVKDEIIAFARNATREWSVHMNVPHCLATAKEADTWLDKVATNEDVAPSAFAVAVPAFEDAQ